MEIASASISLTSRHLAVTRQQGSAKLRTWTGPTGNGNSGQSRQTVAPQSTPSPQISSAASSALSSAAVDQAGSAAENDPFLKLIIAMLEWMTGKPVKIFNASQMQNVQAANSVTQANSAQSGTTSQAPQQAGFGIEYDYHATRQEIEQTSFSAQGTVHTSDGRDIAFNLGLVMSRSQTEQIDVSFRAGDAVRKDPLVINFDGSAAQLSNQRFSFDINSDGQKENLAQLASNSGYLALDLNQNGKIDSGTELFGPTSGSGFADLAKYDQDHNGWIDEKDAVFKQLRIWQPDSGSDGKLTTLKEKNVGALYLGSTGTPFELRSPDNQDLGAVRDSGIYLSENGTAGSLQEIDLTA